MFIIFSINHELIFIPGKLKRDEREYNLAFTSVGHVISLGRAPGILQIPWLAWEETIKNKLLLINTRDEGSCVRKAFEINTNSA